MRTVITACVLVVVVSPAATTRQEAQLSPPSVELPAELARVLRDYEGAYPRGGRDLANLFTEDGFVLAGGRPPIRGRASIAEYYGSGGGPLALRAIAFAVDGSIGYIIGGYSETRGEPDAGKFTLTLRRGSDGRWLVFSDMDNSNRPPRRQPADREAFLAAGAARSHPNSEFTQVTAHP